MTGHEPAFPQPIDDMGTMTCVTAGMSLRAYLAAKAMQGMLAGDSEPDGGYSSKESMCRHAVEYADALIAELNKGEKP